MFLIQIYMFYLFKQTLQRFLEQRNRASTRSDVSVPSTIQSTTQNSIVLDRKCDGDCGGRFPPDRLYLCKHNDCEEKDDIDKKFFCINCGLKDHQWKSHAFNPKNDYIHSLDELIQPETKEYEVLKSCIIIFEIQLLSDLCDKSLYITTDRETGR